MEDVDGVVVARPSTVAARDRYVVPTRPLATVVRRFLDDWNRDRPPAGGKFGASGSRAVEGDVRVSGLDWLSQEATRAAGFPVGRATLEHIAGATTAKGLARRPTTELRLVDAIATALERPDLVSGANALPVIDSLTGDGASR